MIITRMESYKANDGEYDEAITMLAKASSLEPKEGKVFYLLSSVYLNMDQPEKCLEHLERAVALDSYFAILAQNEEEFSSLKRGRKI